MEKTHDDCIALMVELVFKNREGGNLLFCWGVQFTQFPVGVPLSRKGEWFTVPPF